MPRAPSTGPLGVAFGTKNEIGLAMIDAVRARVPHAVVGAEAGTGSGSEFGTGMRGRPCTQPLAFTQARDLRRAFTDDRDSPGAASRSSADVVGTASPGASPVRGRDAGKPSGSPRRMVDRGGRPTGLLPLHVAIGALLAGLGVWVLLAHPGRSLNRALAAVLLLWAGSSIVFELFRGATTPEALAAFRAAASLYEVPTPFLFAFIVDDLFLPKPRSRARKAVLAALACFAVVVGVAFLGYPWAAESVRGAPGAHPGVNPTRIATIVRLWPSIQGFAIFLTESVAVVVASRAATEAPPDSIRRRQAVLVALAFGFLAGHNGGAALGEVLGGTTEVLAWPGIVVRAGRFTGLVAAGYALLRLPGAAQGQARTAVTMLTVLPVALGFFSLSGATGIVVVNYARHRFVWVTAFAIGLALAILRYGLAGPGVERSRRRAAQTAALLALGIAGIAAGAAVSALGTTPLGMGVGLALLVSPASLALPPLRSLRRSLVRAVSIDPHDPALDRERMRVYASALRAAMTTGRAPAASDPGLSELRAQLGLGERDHELLLSAVDDTAEALKPGMLFLGRYRIVRDLGRGGFGEAFLARDEREGRGVVLKRLRGDRSRDAQALRRFQHEARLAATVEHPNIVAVHGTEAGADGAYLVMEYLEGGSLADRLRISGRLTEAEATRIARDALAGLAALHARGILHRDVKPGNILITREGRAKLGDFTIAREVVSGDTEGGAGRAPVGTLAYTAPEQARGMPATPQSDLYSLGASIYEALAGRPIVDVEGLTDYEATLRVAAAAPKLPLDGVSDGTNAWLAAALARDPRERPADARAMADALGEAPAALNPAGTPAGSAPRR